MSLDSTPSVPPGRQLIQSYGDRRFKIAGEVHEGSVIVLADRRLRWPVTAPDEITADSLAPLIEAAENIDILVVGCGPKFGPEPPGLRDAVREMGAVLEWMDTGAACRTFNVLLIEERRAAAAIIAVD